MAAVGADLSRSIDLSATEEESVSCAAAAGKGTAAKEGCAE